MAKRIVKTQGSQISFENNIQISIIFVWSIIWLLTSACASSSECLQINILRLHYLEFKVHQKNVATSPYTVAN